MTKLAATLASLRQLPASSRVRIAAHALLTVIAVMRCGPALRAFLELTFGRLHVPHALWWLEPIFFRAALAAHRGLPLYGPPSLEYTPPIYNPGLSLVGAALFDVFGARLPVLRSFSFACLLALAAAVAWWAGRASRAPAIAIVAFALVLSTALGASSSITVTNVDTPYLLFCVLACAVVALEVGDARWRVVASALCVVIAFGFKQPACLIAAPIALHLLLQKRSHALLFVALTAGSAALLVALWLLVSSGWYWTYAMEIPLRTPHVAKPELLAKLRKGHELAVYAMLLAPLALTWLGPKSTRFLWLPLALALAIMARSGFTKAGGGPNTLLPFYLGGVLLFAMLPQLAQAASQLRFALPIELLLVALVVFTGSAFASDKLRAFHKKEARALPVLAAFDRRLQRELAHLPKPVFVGARVFDVNAPMNTHQTGLYEGSVRTQVFDLNVVLAPALSKHPYRSMLVWEYKNRAFNDVLARYYRRTKVVGRDPLIGTRVGIWVPR